MSERDPSGAASGPDDELCGALSHYLLNSLNVMVGYADLLARNETDPVRSEHLARIVRSGHDSAWALTATLELLDPPARCVPQIIELDPLFDEFGVELDDRLASGRVSLPDAADLLVEGDPGQLLAVLRELVGNAFRHGGPEVDVELSVRSVPHPEGARIAISVSDDGQGSGSTGPTELGRPFVRGALSAGRPGLGLALARQRVADMGGTLEIADRTPAGFTVVVEMRSPRPPSSPSRTSVPAASDSAPTRMADPKIRSVLCIEDHVVNARLVERLVARHDDIELHVAASGSAGCELALASPPDVVLLDLHLPDIDGLEVLRRLRRDRRTEAVPVVVVSADASRDRIDQVMAAGADDYLVKPFEIDRFDEIISRFCR